MKIVKTITSIELTEEEVKALEIVHDIFNTLEHELSDEEKIKIYDENNWFGIDFYDLSWIMKDVIGTFEIYEGEN